jgi:hypothetical protein
MTVNANRLQCPRGTWAAMLGCLLAFALRVNASPCFYNGVLCVAIKIPGVVVTAMRASGDLIVTAAAVNKGIVERMIVYPLLPLRLR